MRRGCGWGRRKEEEREGGTFVKPSWLVFFWVVNGLFEERRGGGGRKGVRNINTNTNH